MKKIKLERWLLVPDSNYCIMWKSTKEVCQKLTFGKVADKPNLVYRCAFFEQDIEQNIDSYGIKKYCEEYKTDANVYNILDRSKII